VSRLSPIRASPTKEEVEWTLDFVDLAFGLTSNAIAGPQCIGDHGFNAARDKWIAEYDAPNPMDRLRRLVSSRTEPRRRRSCAMYRQLVRLAEKEAILRGDEKK